MLLCNNKIYFWLLWKKHIIILVEYILITHNHLMSCHHLLDHFLHYPLRIFQNFHLHHNLPNIHYSFQNFHIRQIFPNPDLNLLLHSTSTLVLFQNILIKRDLHFLHRGFQYFLSNRDHLVKILRNYHIRL